MTVIKAVFSGVLLLGLFATFADYQDRHSVRHTMPLVCLSAPDWSIAGLPKHEPNRCFDGTRHRWLMKGYGKVEMEGGVYLVGWPK